MAIQNIDYYIEEVKKGHIDGGERRTKAYTFKEDNVILVQKYQKNFAELKERIKKCKMLGINIPAYIDYKIDNDKRGWILQELAKGKEFASLVNNEKGTNIIANIPYEHIENYLRDVYLLNANGIGVEPRRRNIFYDETVGFTTIDVAALDLTKDSDSLENVNNFFHMYSPVFRIPLSNDENDKNLNEKNTSKVLRAFEKSHPFFGKYKRWIYRGDPYFANFAKEHGDDLTLDSKEYEEFTNFIDELVNRIVNEKINCPEEFGYNYHTSYIKMLEESIAYCPNFTLYDTNEQSLKEYINHLVYERIKSLFFENRNNCVLRDLYFKVREREIDPLNIYDSTQVTADIKKEIDEYYKKNLTKEITPVDATKNALAQGTTTTKADEAKGVEQSELNLEKSKEGETKDG